MTPRLETARDVSEYLLDRTGRALETGDFDTFKTCFILPQEVDTFEGTQRLETEADIERTFNQVREHYRSLGTTQIERHCVSAVFKGPDCVEATHVTRVVAQDRILQNPFYVFSVLKRTEGGWKIAFSQYAIDDAPNHNAALLGRYRGKTRPDTQQET